MEEKNTIEKGGKEPWEINNNNEEKDESKGGRKRPKLLVGCDFRSCPAKRNYGQKINKDGLFARPRTHSKGRKKGVSRVMEKI